MNPNDLSGLVAVLRAGGYTDAAITPSGVGMWYVSAGGHSVPINATQVPTLMTNPAAILGPPTTASVYGPAASSVARSPVAQEPNQAQLTGQIASGYLNGIPTLERERFYEANRQFELSHEQLIRQVNEQIAARLANNTLTRESLAEIVRSAQAQEAQARATLAETTRQYDVGQSGYLNGAPTMAREQQEFTQGTELARIMGNPRNIAQSLYMALPPQQAGQVLASMASGLGLGGGSLASSILAPPATGTLAPAAPGTNPLQGTIRPRQMQVRQTLSDLQSSSPRTGLYEGLFSAAGYTPENTWGEFQRFLPKGPSWTELPTFA